MNKPKRLNFHRGFSLLELLIAVAVLAVTTVIAAPSLAAMGDRLKLSSLSEDIFVHLLLARSESIKRGGRVALCKSRDGETCTSTGSWEQGWIVFHDTNNDGIRGPGEAIVQRMGGLPQGWRLAGNLPVAKYISYDPTGTTRLVSGGFQAGTLTLCRVSEGPVSARQIVLNAAGRPRMQSTTITVCA